jgi:hypothetical protein
MIQCLDFTSFLSQQEIARYTLECVKVAKYVRYAGRLPGSLEPDSTAGVDYWVADGHLVRRHVPEVGKEIFLEGQRYPHEVETVTSGIRASLIFEYLVSGRDVNRSKGLSSALYGL